MSASSYWCTADASLLYMKWIAALTRFCHCSGTRKFRIMALVPEHHILLSVGSLIRGARLGSQVSGVANRTPSAFH